MINAYKQHVGWTDRLGNQGKSTFESDALKQGEFHEFCRHLQPGLHCMKYMEYKKEPWYPGLPRAVSGHRNMMSGHWFPPHVFRYLDAIFISYKF